MRTAYKGTNRLWMLLIAMLLVCGMAFGAIAEESAAQTVTNDLDGSKIEGVKVIWVTQDSATTAEGAATPQTELDKKEHLYLSSVSDSPVEMVYRIEAEFSGQYDYAPGDITITIPAQVWYGRKYEATGVEGETVGVVDENRLLGYLELPVPAAPSKKADFNWQIIDGNYVLTNTRTIGATSSVSIEVGIRGIRPVDVVDMSETAPITAHVEVVTNQGNTIELTSTPITAQLDTQARITDAYKNGEVFEDYPGLDEKLLANLPADANPNDYIYVRWYTYHSHNNNQPYSLDIADVLSDAYEKVVGEDGQIEEQYVTDGIFLGSTNYEGQVLTDGEIDFTAEIGDHFTTTTTGTQYANTVYMWSAYKKSAFYVPSANETQHVYYFKNEVTWTLTETDKKVEDSGNGKGEDPQKVTTAKDDVILPYAPVKWQRPRGVFAVNKWTERVGYKDWLYGYALNLLESREEVDMDFIVETVGYGYPWTSKLTRDYSYGELNNTVVNGDLEKLELDASAFGKLGWKQVTDDFQTFFNFETEPLTSEDFEFKSLRVSVPGKMRYAKKSNGTWDYVSDSTLPTPDLMIEYQLNNEDTWYPAATATWGEDGLGEFKFVNVADGVTTSGMTVFFPEKVTDTRHTFISNVFDGKMAEQCDIAMLDWYVYPTITMKSSDRVYGIVQELFEQSENPSTKFRNDVIMDAYGWVGSDDEAKVLDDDYDYSMATYEGASYGVALTKSGTSESDAENQRLVIHYTATLTEQSNLKERSDYDEAVEAGVIPAETSGIWYDLLPPHVVPLLDTIKLRKGDTITNVYTVEDYKDTGRTLLVVEAELTPVPASYNSIGYADRPTLEFDAAYTWMDMDEYGSELVNYVAFESTVEDLRNDTLGTIKNQMGDPDTPAGGNNANTPSMPEDIIKALTDLDPNTDENRFVYGKYSHTVSSLTYAVSGLQKAVKNDLVGIWTQGLDGQEQVTVYEGHYYTYSLRVSSAENTATKGIVIYDTIENYIIPDPDADEDTDATKRADYEHTQERKDWSGYWKDKGQWRGTLTQVDLSEFVKAKVKPVLLYSTIDNLQFADSSSESTDDNFDEDTELFSSGSYDITDREIWQVAELDENGIWQVPEDVAVTAVAIDATTTTDGKEFVLRPEEALAGYLKMRAPDDDSDENTWKAKGAYARKADNPAEIDWEAAVKAENNMYAYNNARVRLMQGNTKTTTQIDPETGKEVEVENTTWLSNLRMIRNDYTRVGIVPEIVTVEKTWQDQNDHDAMRPESVTIKVLRRLAGTAGEAQPVLDKDGQPLTAVLDKSNGWKAEFKQVDIVNEDGVRYLYTFEEEPVEGYTSKVQFIDVNHYTMINVHPNEQVDISGEKTWSDDNNALGFRPAVVTLKLYRDGEQIDTRIVKPNGAGEWKYTFGKLDKYAEGGKEYEYRIEEEYVPKYVGEANGYEMVNNTYIPVGALEVSKTLVGATDAAKDKEFTFTLVLLAEQTDPTAPAVPLMDKYAYTIYTRSGAEWVAGETGEIGNSGTFKLKDNQKIVVYDLPSEATYEVIESEAAGFTSKATDADGSIRAGQTVQAAFVNEYKASGSVQLNVGKSLTGHAIRKNQFRFELVDNNPDSSTYGEVIRTARVEAPEEGATTGGSGVEIESLTQAIFGQLEYTQADDGNTYKYQVREVDTGKSGYTADDMVFNVAVSVTDNGDGTMTVTPAYTDAAGEVVTELKFENEYHAEGELTLKAWKTLEGRELKEDEFTFELWSYDAANNGLGEKLGEATNDAEGNIVFDALEFDENDVSLDENKSATYTYLIREKQGTDKTVAYSNQEYVMTVTVFDNGDGTLSFAQGSQQAEREYSTCKRCAGNGYDFIPIVTYDIRWENGQPGYTDKATHYYGYRENGSQATNGYIYHMVPFCDVCWGRAKDSDGDWCSNCHGSGLAENSEYIKPSNFQYQTTPYCTFLGYVQIKHYTDGNVWVVQQDRIRESSSYTYTYYNRVDFEKLRTCTSCNGAGVVPGKMTITGDVTIPVFANELKPGDLTVTKQVQGEGSSNPDQTFNFTIKLTGEVPEDLDYGMTAPTPVPTATPAPAGTATPAPFVFVTPAPTTQPNTPAPITQPVPTTVPVVAAPKQPVVSAPKATPYVAKDLDGDPFAVLNESTGEFVFFRAESIDNVYTYNGKASGNTNVEFTMDADTVKTSVVSSDGINYTLYRVVKVDANRTFGWYGNTKIKTVSMEGDIKPSTIFNMFYGCSSMVSADLSRMDTQGVSNLASGMFKECSSLKTLTGLTFDISSVTSISQMFQDCKVLTDLDLGCFDTSNVTSMAQMFKNCAALKNLDLLHFNTTKTKDMGGMFYGCSGLTELDLSSFDTRNVTTMYSMFGDCKSLTSLDLSNFDTSKVTNMNYDAYWNSYGVYGGMFRNCSALTSLDLSSFDTSRIKDMRYMFTGCSSLTTLDLGSFNTSNATDMRAMFYGCSGLTELGLSTFDTSKVTTMSQMFYGCSGLTTLDLSTFDTSSVKYMSSMFSGCSGLTSLDLSNFDTSSATSLGSMFYRCSGLTSLDLSNFDTSNATDVAAMFLGCSGLTKIDLSNFNTSKVTTMQEMFYGCSGLTALDLSTFDTAQVTNMDRMFQGCSGLTSLDLKTFNTSNVVYFKNMFADCSSLTSLNVSSFDTAKCSDFENVFKGCSSLTSLDLRNFVTSKASGFDYMFYNCSALTSLNVSSFDGAGAYNTDYMFYGCSGLTAIDLGNFTTPKLSSTAHMFCGCTNLAWLDFGQFDTSKMDKSSHWDFNQMFYQANSIQTVTIGDNSIFYDGSSNYPYASRVAPYNGTWVNVQNEDQVFGGRVLFTAGGHAGTWTWYVSHYKLNFAPGEGGAGAMPSVNVLLGTEYSFVPQFYQFGYDLIGFVDDKGVTYNVSGGLVTIPANNGYQDGQTVTLTAVWQERDVTVSESGDTITFALKAGETFTLSDLPASLAYEVWEELPTGWVLVEKKDDTGVIKPLETSEAVFTNAYQPEKAQAILRASKTLDGEAPESGKFSFTLSEGDTEIETVTNDGSGVVFKTITYEKEDVRTHTYTIKEGEGTDTTINYDAAVYTVTVEVTDDGQGNLSAEVTYLDADGKELTEPPVFKNTTKPGALFISKAIIGATEKAEKQKFTFEVTFTDELLNVWKTGTVSLKGGESITVADIPAGLKYEVKETGSYPGWTMDGTIKEGKIASNETAEVTFTNAYTLTGVASIEAKKVLVGRDLTAGEFTFQLVGENNNVVAEATNGADGRVLFPQMTYTEEGTWEYVIVEAKPNEDKIDNTVEYSGQRIEVTVTAKDEKGDGTLTTSVAYSPEKTPITNTLKPGALEISKTVVSSNPDHAEKVFTFTVTLTDAEGAPLNGSYTLNETLALPVQNGKVEITLKGGETATISKLPAGTQYSVTEAKEAGFTTEMTGDSGVIMSNETAYAAFINTYAAEGEYTIEGIKTLEGTDLATEQFTFELTMLQADGSETVLETVTNDADGKITFSKLIFTDLDEGEYVYRIREVNDRKPGFTYDDTVYEFTLIVKDNSDGTMTITPEGLPKGGIEFKNTYNDKTSVSVEKVWADEENKLGVRPVSVTVELYRNGEKRDEVVLNTGNTWKHTFSELPAFDENGVTYTYTVKELPVTGYDGMQSVKDGVNVFTNTVQGVLDVTKTVVAGMDAEKEFAFTVTLTKADEPLTTEVILEKADVREAVKPDAEGKVRFTLKDGETARLIGLPIGTEYKVEEAPEAGYTATAENAEGLIQRFEKHTAVFTNTYEATGDITFEGIKTIDGRKMTEKDIFAFEVSENGTTNTWTVQSGADGKIVYPKIEYIHNAEKSDLGEHTYTVKETSTNGKGITVAKNTYTVMVNVSDKGDGTLDVVASDNAKALNFTNTYKATGSVIFEGTKTISGRKMTDKDVFTFSITEQVAEGKTGFTGTATNDADGKIAYPTISYTLADVGDHTYTVKETSTDGKGITVAKNSYTVTVNVSDNGDGTLDVVASDNAKALNFTNTYKATGSVTFEGTKTIVGRKMTDKDIFAFEVSENGTTNTWTVQNGADGKIVYPTIEYIHNAEKSDLGEHTYTVKETSTDGKGITVDTKTYEIKVTVTDNGDGTLKVIASDNHKALNFTNTYEAKGKVDFIGLKKLEGRELKEGEFSFILLDKDGKELETVKNSKDGEITFTTLEYIHNAKQSDLGEHTYTVKEVRGDLGGVTYDETAYEVTVTVTDNGDGTLDVVASDNHKALNFTNTYEAKGKVDFFGEKTLEGRELKEGEFSFILLDKDGKELETVKNGADGKIAFTTLNYIHNTKQSDLGEHTYTVKEVQGELGGVTYDETAYEVKVTVTDNGDGTLEVVASDNAKALNFTNTYEAKGKVDFTGLKKLEGRELKEGEFSFILQDKDGKEIETVKNGKDGKIAFTTLEYIHNAKQSDLGEHTYTVKEVLGDLDGVTYDETTYEIKVTVTDNGDGTLKVVASDNHKALNFVNTYEADGTVRFKGTKQLVGREFRSGDVFLFELVENGVTIQRSRLTPVEGKEAAFEFNPIEYTTADIGTHTYLIREEKGSLKGVTYDATEYTVTVTVADAGNGELSVSKAYAVDGEAAEKVLFTNTYEAKGELTLTAEKTVNGAQPTADQVFDFTLSDASGEIETVQNKLGEIEFAKLTYTLDDLGEHVYTVKENKTDKAGYAIDETVYTVKVNVTDNGDGTLKAAKKISANGKTAESMIFDNKHSATLTISKKVEGCTTEETFPIKVWLFDAKGNELKGEYAYTGDVTGKLTSGTTIELGHGQTITIENLPVGSRYKVEETRDPRFTTTVNSLAINTAEGEIVEGGNTAAFVNRLVTTMFKIRKEWQGGDGGKIILTLYANGEKLEEQPAYTQEGDMYYYTGLPMYDEDGDEIIYSAKEKYVDGYLTIYKNVEPYAEETKAIYNGGTIINKAITTIKVQKVWSGLAEGAEVPEITLILHCNGEVYDRKTPDPDEDGWYVYSNLPVFVNGERAVYSVTEEPMEGCSTIYTNNGEEGDCAYNGGVITNIVVPKTGDDAPVELWAAAMLLSAAALVLMARRKKAN